MTTSTPTLLDLRLDPAVKRVDRFRGHRFQLPAADARKLPALYATEGVPLNEKTVGAHWFSPSMDWYAVELDPGTMLAFGYVFDRAMPECSEWGLFDLAELAPVLVKSAQGWPVWIERDCFWVPCKASEVVR